MAHTRRLPLWDAHQALSPVWQPSGYWMRPRVYPRPGESVAAAGLREARTVRASVGFVDVSTLGKFEIAGPDAARLLERVCATPVAKLAVGRGRYTFMLREDGLVFDDGTVWRLADDRYLLTSSTGGAERMDTHIAYARSVLEPALRVAVANVQEHWGAIAVAGPKARDIIAELAGVGPPRHMSASRATIAGVPSLILAASFSGERAFEVYAPGLSIRPVWAEIARAAAAVGGCPYGLEALDYLRIEKGHLVVGAEIDGRTTPADLGLGRMVRASGGYVGWQNLQRPVLSAPDRLRLVGLEAGQGMIPEGAMLLPRAGATPEGHVTAAGPRLQGEGGIALALLRGGPDRLGETLIAHSPTRGRTMAVRVVEPVFFDAAGEAYRD